MNNYLIISDHLELSISDHLELNITISDESEIIRLTRLGHIRDHSNASISDSPK
ncbi:hypothetical protein HanPI659440_Chr04g0145561 [Helianthus annuus]|nr:hypothetical protein HanPI659440_Chr04g0145561 [Helianthus annuus]